MRSTPACRPSQQTTKPKPTLRVMPRIMAFGEARVAAKKSCTPEGLMPEKVPVAMCQQ